MKRFLYGICAFFVLLTAFCPAVRVVAEPEQNQEQETQGQEGQSGSLALSSPSALLMEASRRAEKSRQYHKDHDLAADL